MIEKLDILFEFL